MSIDLPNMHVTPPKGADGFPQSFFSSLPIAYMNGMNGQGNRAAADIGSLYAAQFQAKLQACQNNGTSSGVVPKGDNVTEGEDGRHSEDDDEGDDDQASRISGDDDSPAAAASSRRNGDGSVDEDGSDDRSTPHSWTKGDDCENPSPSIKALAAS